jgi:PTS system mannose-specific IID component
MAEVVKVSKAAQKKCLVNWFLSCAVGGNYENMHGTGFMYSMLPVVKELYPNDVEKQKEVLTRHITFINTEPEVGTVIHGVTIAMEEQIAAGADCDADQVVGLKSALMGPLAGIGDSLIQGIIIPILLALCIDLTKGGLVIGPILYAVAVYAIMIVCMWLCFKLGYSKGGDAIVDMMAKGTLNRIMNAAGIVGCCVMGGLIVKYVHIACALDFFIGKTEFNIQTTLFDAICPNLLPLLLTLACVAGLRKGKKSLSIILMMVAFGIVFGALGIFSAGA